MSFTCPCEIGHPQDCLEHSQECDEILPSTTDEYESDPRDEEPNWSDSDTTREMVRDLGAK